MLQLKMLEMVIGTFFHGHCLIKRVIAVFRPMKKEVPLVVSERKEQMIWKAEAWNIFLLNQSRKDYLESVALFNFKTVLGA